ncbi:MAG: hypothetical protein ABIQ30_13415 [Devosia sp.]
MAIDMMVLRILTLGAIGTLAWSVAPVLAQDCVRYAASATQDARTAAEAKCGFSGDLWSLDPGTHLAFCLQTTSSGNQTKILAAAQSRKTALDACQIALFNQKNCPLESLGLFNSCD